jgi:cell division protein FtsW (lipid II flippase)
VSLGDGVLGTRRFAERVDRPALLAILGLLGISLVTLYSVTHVPLRGDYHQVLVVGPGIFYRQIVWVLLGLGALYLGFWTPYRLLEASAWLQYGASFLLLVAVLLIGRGADVERWIHLGPIQFQPSEFAKVSLIFVLARYLAGRSGNGDRLSGLIVPGLIVLLPVALILKQPDLGTALVFLAILIPMLFWHGLKLGHIVLLGSPAVGFLMHLYLRTQEHMWWPWLVFVLAVFVLTLLQRAYLWENI